MNEVDDGSRAVRPVCVPAERAWLLRSDGRRRHIRTCFTRKGIRWRMAVSDRHRRRRRSLRSARRGRRQQLLGRRTVTAQSRPCPAARPATRGVQGPSHRPARVVVPATAEVFAHHSFHVFVVYPWVRFLRRDAATALGVMQDCRIRWGTVESVAGEHAMIASRPLQLENGMLTLGEPRPERVQWKKGDLSLAPAPALGSIVSAHWDWVCGTLSDAESAALEAATQASLDLVNACSESASVTAGSEHTGGLTGDRP